MQFVFSVPNPQANPKKKFTKVFCRAGNVQLGWALFELFWNQCRCQWYIPGRCRWRRSAPSGHTTATAATSSWPSGFAGAPKQQESGPKRGSLKSTGKRQDCATFLQRSFVNFAGQFFVRCSAAFGKNDIRTAEKRMLHCSFCSASFQKLQCNFCFSLVA